eukprot:COSAG02_NODE_14978_length_1218_cov_1.301162_2_plen_192_part_00
MPVVSMMQWSLSTNSLTLPSSVATSRGELAFISVHVPYRLMKSWTCGSSGPGGKGDPSPRHVSAKGMKLTAHWALHLRASHPRSQCHTAQGKGEAGGIQAGGQAGVVRMDILAIRVAEEVVARSTKARMMWWPSYRMRLAMAEPSFRTETFWNLRTCSRCGFDYKAWLCWGEYHESPNRCCLRIPWSFTAG